MSSNENLNALLSGFDFEEIEDDLLDNKTEENALLTALLDSQKQSENLQVKVSKPITIQSGSNLLTKVSDTKSSQPSTSCPVFDPKFGICIRNPKVDLKAVDTYCQDMVKIRVNSLQKTSIPNSEWTTMAVIVAKTECRKSANDKEYIIWQVSDLCELQDIPIKVLLFGECVKQHWKLQVGMTVLLVNPVLAEGENDKQVTLKVSKAAQILDIGFCPDLGTCKAFKINGNPCTVHVNLSKTDYCAYHIQSAVKKLSARRGTFGSTSNIPPKSWRTQELPPPCVQPTDLKTTNRGSSLKYVKPMDRRMKVLKKLPKSESNTLQENSANLTPDQLLRNESGGVKRKKDIGSVQSSSQPPEKRVKSMKEFIHSQENKPNLGSRALFGFIDLISPEKKKKTNRAGISEEMKIKKAAEILRKSKNSSSQPSGRSICRNLTNQVCGLDGAYSSSEKSPSDDQILALMNKKSKFEDQAVEVLQERQNKYFVDREFEEKVETNATTLMEIKNCKVVSCLACDYTSIHQSEYCKSLGHLVKRHIADKRFFRCKNCKTRISCFKLMPTKPCRSCLMLDYERVAMRDERKVREDKLLIRGEERKFIN